MKYISKDMLIGYLAGCLNGISMRADVSTEVIETCVGAYATYINYFEQERKEKDK